MKPELFLPLVITAVIAVAGWYVAYLAVIRRDRLQKRRDLTVQYLIEAYRRLERAANTDMKAPVSTDLESAIADMLLFGSAQQVQYAQEFSKSMARTGEASLDPLLRELRGAIFGRN